MTSFTRLDFLSSLLVSETRQINSSTGETKGSRGAKFNLCEYHIVRSLSGACLMLSELFCLHDG